MDKQLGTRHRVYRDGRRAGIEGDSAFNNPYWATRLDHPFRFDAWQCGWMEGAIHQIPVRPEDSEESFEVTGEVGAEFDIPTVGQKMVFQVEPLEWAPMFGEIPIAKTPVGNYVIHLPRGDNLFSVRFDSRVQDGRDEVLNSGTLSTLDEAKDTAQVHWVASLLEAGVVSLHSTEDHAELVGRVKKAVTLANAWGGDNLSHKQWVVDKMVKILTDEA